jgi:hypothetical protein
MAGLWEQDNETMGSTKTVNFLTSWATITFSGNILHPGVT